jgi:prepilin-type processing-associated H-X9-DG protein
MNKFRIALSLLVAAGAAVFALRHHSLRQLQAEHAQLEHRSEEASNGAAVIPPPPIAESPTNAVLSAAERSELLRLRGQVGSLRQELAQATNDLAKLSRPTRATSSDATEEPIVSKPEAMQIMSAGRQWMIALTLYAQTNRGQLPTTLAEVSPSLQPAEGLDDFEFVPSARLDFRPGMSSRTIVLRTKQPWKGTRGRWERAYAFADGHVELALSDTLDFTAWEEGRQKLPDNLPVGQ